MTTTTNFFFKSIKCHTFSEPQARSDFNDDDDNEEDDDDHNNINDDNKEEDDNDKKLNKCEYQTTQKPPFLHTYIINL